MKARPRLPDRAGGARYSVEAGDVDHPLRDPPRIAAGVEVKSVEPFHRPETDRERAGLVGGVNDLVVVPHGGGINLRRGEWLWPTHRTFPLGTRISWSSDPLPSR